MNVEIVEFYPNEWDKERDSLTGTLRIKLDIGIHILGIYVFKRKGSWFFSLPGRDGTNHDTGETVRYPFIVFDDRDKQRELIDAIRIQGRAFIETRLADTANPLVWPQQKIKKPKENDVKSMQNQKAKDNDSSAQKEVPVVTHTREKVWVTPPPIKKKAFNSFGTSRLK